MYKPDLGDPPVLFPDLSDPFGHLFQKPETTIVHKQLQNSPAVNMQGKSGHAVQNFEFFNMRDFPTLQKELQPAVAADQIKNPAQILPQFGKDTLAETVLIDRLTEFLDELIRLHVASLRI